MIVSSLLLLDPQAPALDLRFLRSGGYSLSDRHDHPDEFHTASSTPAPCPPSGFLSGVSPSSLDHPRFKPLFPLNIHLSRLALTGDSPAFSEIRWS
jgi:hypothetical protein